MTARLIDIPYDSSPAIIFTYRQTAALVAGQYDFSGTGTLAKNAFTPSRPLQPAFLYIFKTLSFGMDIAQEDYHSAIATQPQFSAYVASDAAAPAFREPVALSMYFQNLPYIITMLGGQFPGDSYPGSVSPGVQAPRNINRLLGTVTGVLNQTGNLLGKASVTAIIMLTAQEVVDEEFVSCFRGQNKNPFGQRPVDAGRAWHGDGKAVQERFKSLRDMLSPRRSPF